MADIHDTDDGFHEIHLSGKQLVFLFMATTVVSVVIFLCGVFVGRGVHAQQPTEHMAVPTPPAVATSSVPLADSAPQTIEPPAPPTEAVELSFTQRLDRDAPSASLGRTPAARTEPAPPPAAARTASRTEPAAPEPVPSRTAGRTSARETPSPTRSGPTATDPSDSWVVQVHALRDRNAASAIVQRLVAKGYPAFLASAGSAGIYRVQVGRFTDKQEAERTRARLKNEEKYDPWITH